MPNPTEYRFNKEKRETVMETITKREKQLKGPADYSTERKYKIKGHYQSAVPSGGFMQETEFLAAESPAPTKYEADKAKMKQKKRSPEASLTRDGKGPRPICLPYKKDDSPNPFTYKDVDTNWSKLSPHPTTQGQIWKKEKAGSWLEVHQKDKKFVPGPGYRDVSIETIKKTATCTYNNQRRRM